MGVTWDKGTYAVDNQAGQTMTLNDYQLSSGKWGERPATSIANGTKKAPAFVAQSKDDELIGPSGYVKYGLPDGTVMIIRFAVPYGTSSQYLQATFEGPRAGQYKIDPNPPETEQTRSNGGAGKRVTGTVVPKKN
jgi:hypothetical protein